MATPLPSWYSKAEVDRLLKQLSFVSTVTQLDAQVAALLLDDKSATRAALAKVGSGASNGTGTGGATPALSSTAAPVVSGTPSVGSVLTVSNGAWSAAPDTFSYQWRRNGAALPQVTSTYTTVAADAGQVVSCTVTAQKNGYTPGSASSNDFTVNAGGVASGDWTQADGSPWDSSAWSVARAAAGTVQSKRGVLTTSAGAFSGDANAVRTGSPAVADSSTYVEFATDATVQEQYVIVGARVPSGTPATGNSFPSSGYFVEVAESTGTVQLRKTVSGAVTQLGNTVTVSSGGIPASSIIAVRLDVTGARVRAKVWNTASAEPTAYTYDYTDPSPYSTAGKPFLSVQNGAGAGARSSAFRNFSVSATTTAANATTVTAAATSTVANQATLSWSVFNGPVANLTGWLVSRNGTDTNGTGPWSTTVDPSTTSFSFTALAGSTEYTLSVQAVISGTPGSPSASAKITPTGSSGGGSTTPVVSTSKKFQGLTLPSRGWFSGASGDQVDNNSTGFGSWRGDATDALATWIDGSNGSAWGGGIGANTGPAANAKMLLDIAIGGPTDYGAAAGGSMDSALTSLLQRLRAARTINGTLYPTVIRPFHELNGNWYGHSVNSGNLDNFRATARRWRSIATSVFPEAVWALCYNGDSGNTNVTPTQTWEDGVWDAVGVDRYNQYPFIGTNRTGGYVSWADGSTRGTADNPIGAERWRQFAYAHGVPIYFPEYAQNGYDSGTPANSGDDPYWVRQWFAWVKANAGTGAGKVFAEVWFNQIKEENRWLLYSPGNTIRQPTTAQAYADLFPIT